MRGAARESRLCREAATRDRRRIPPSPRSVRAPEDFRGTREGICLELSETAVRRWEDRRAVMQRSGAMEEVHRAWRRERDLPEATYQGARFVLLHSLAHMLIQGLALDCGYSSTSIRERIYSW